MAELSEPTTWHEIGRFNFASLAKDYDLVGCGRCGAAVPKVEELLAQHDKFHAVLNHNDDILPTMQRNVRWLRNWIKKFEEMNS